MKKYIFTILISILVLFCILNPENMIASTKSALALWATIILPSLFPFMILTNLIQKTALPYLLQKFLSPLMTFLFNLPGVASLAISLGMTGGYPIGAKVTNDLLKDNSITISDANHLITFVNNTGPLFMLGAVGIGIYKSTAIGLLLIISHYLSAILIGIMGKFTKEKTKPKNNKNITFNIIKISDIGNTLNEVIKKSIDTILTVGGFIILFSIISTFLEQTKLLTYISQIFLPMLKIETSTAIFTGLLEVTNGINKIATVQISLLEKLIITSSLISFGGMSIHFQTLSIISKSKISFLKYLTGKLLHGLLSGIITYLLLTYTNLSNILPINTLYNISPNSIEFSKIENVILGFFIFIVLFKIYQLFTDREKF